MRVTRYYRYQTSPSNRPKSTCHLLVLIPVMRACHRGLSAQHPILRAPSSGPLKWLVGQNSSLRLSKSPSFQVRLLYRQIYSFISLIRSLSSVSYRLRISATTYILPGPLQDTCRYSYYSTHPSPMRNAGHTGSLGARYVACPHILIFFTSSWISVFSCQASHAPLRMPCIFQVSHVASPDSAEYVDPLVLGTLLCSALVLLYLLLRTRKEREEQM
jgi:hypothetical protein